MTECLFHKRLSSLTNNLCIHLVYSITRLHHAPEKRLRSSQQARPDIHAVSRRRGQPYGKIVLLFSQHDDKNAQPLVISKIYHQVQSSYLKSDPDARPAEIAMIPNINESHGLMKDPCHVSNVKQRNRKYSSPGKKP
jgi:hypothetical protein